MEKKQKPISYFDVVYRLTPTSGSIIDLVTTDELGALVNELVKGDMFSLDIRPFNASAAAAKLSGPLRARAQ